MKRMGIHQRRERGKTWVIFLLGYTALVVMALGCSPGILGKDSPGPYLDSGADISNFDTGSTLDITVDPTVDAAVTLDITVDPTVDAAVTLDTSDLVADKPIITTQPAPSQTLQENETCTFSLTATGNGTLSYQWRKDGLDLTGATSATLTLGKIQIADAGTYTCVVTNTLGVTTATATSDNALLVVNASSIIFHVSPTGTDTDPGTPGQPFASLERARNAIRALKAQLGGLPANGVKVLLHGGIYARSTTFNLTDQDSGTAASPIIYAAAPGETPILSGGTLVNPICFTPVTDTAILNRVIDPVARATLLRCDLGAQGITDYGQLSRHGFYKANLGLTPPMELFINGERMMLGRWPNPGDAAPPELNPLMVGLTGVVVRSGIIDAGPDMNDTDFLDRGGTFSYSFTRPELWSQATDIWLDGIFTWSWEWSYNKVASIDTVNKRITLRYGEVSGIVDKYSGDFFFAENLLEEIDLPGEYFIDRATGMLYLLPPGNFNDPSTNITLSTLTTPMIDLVSASHVWIQGLILETGRGMAINCNKGEGVRIDHCEVRNFASGAIQASGKNHGVTSSHIHHIGGFGVSIGGGDWNTLDPGGSFVENNDIHHVAYYNKVYNPAVVLQWRSVGNRVSHNKIHDTPHVAVVYYGNDHLIEYNEFYQVITDFIDMGAVYANQGRFPFERGTVVRRNWFHDFGNVRSGSVGVYPDNNTMGTTIEENVFQRIGGIGKASASRAINVNAGAWILTRHNIFVDCSFPFNLSTYAASDTFYTENVAIWTQYFSDRDLSQLPHDEKYPELVNFWTEERQYPTTNTFQGNLIYNASIPLLTSYGSSTLVEGTLDVKNLLQRSDNWVTITDPGFVNVSGGDLSLLGNAPVFTQIPGFPNIPFQDIGLTGPVGP